ncbi:MAG: response regulator, partial [Desulfovibrio sp.]
DILLEQLLAIWEGVGRIELKAQVLTIKGKTIHCIVKFFLQESDGGLDLSSMVLALLDITEIKRAEEILKRSEARYRAIVEDQTDLICRYLPDGAISFVNDAYARYFGRGAGDFLGLHFLPPMPREEVEKVTDAVQSLSLDRPVCSVEHRVFRGEEERWQQWTHRAIFDAQGRLMERQAVGQDVTERKRMEHDLKRAMEEARAASTYKSEFLAAVSHEVRTPLTAILGLSEHIMDKGGAEEHLPDLGRIHRAGQNLLQLINEILDLSKIEAGKLEIEYSDFNPHALALEMGEMFLANAESKNLAMDWDIAPEVPDWVHGCEARIRQVLYNLLGNAVKFTDQGSITMGLALDSENTLRFQVTDTGIGIEHDKLSAIFDPYAQEGGFVSRKYGGTGLGLAIAKRLVEMMGGTIQAESQKGEGATFTFTAPVKPAVTSKPERKHGKAVLPSLPALRILIAEDDPTNQIIARRYLEDLDHHVTLVSDGRSAVELYEEREFDLVLMDIQMPELSGTEATRRIRKLEAAQDRPRTPILALTADAMKDNRSKFLDAGMDGYAFKPFDFPKLMVQIQGVMVSLGLIPGAADTPRQGADVSLPGENAQAPGHTTAPSPNSELLDVAGAPVARKIWLLGAAIFLEDTPEQVEALAELARNGDAPAVKELAHKLKGAAGNVRAVRMQQLAEEIERAGADNDLDAVRKKAALLREAWDGTAIALQREIQAEQ